MHSSFAKTRSFTPSKEQNSTQSTFYSTSAYSSPQTKSNAFTTMQRTSYNPNLASSSQGLDLKLQGIQHRYEKEADNNLKNYHSHYQGHVALGNTVVELEAILDRERQKSQALQDRLNEALRAGEQDKRQKIHVERENTDLRTELRRREKDVADYESKLSIVQQSVNSVHFENDGWRSESKKLSDAYNAKLKELEEKYSREGKTSSEELENLRSEMKERDIDNEARMRDLSRNLEAKIRSLENQIREKDRIISETESDLQASKDYNMKLKMEYEEELRKQIRIVRDDDRNRYEASYKELENKLKRLEADGSVSNNKISELDTEIQSKEYNAKELRFKLEEQIGNLKKENMGLRDQVSVYESEIEKLHIEIKGKDSAIIRCQKEIANLDQEAKKQKETYQQENSRIQVRTDNEVRKYQENERQYKEKINELERTLRDHQGDYSKLKSDLQRFRDQVTGSVNHTISQTFVDYSGKNSVSRLGY